MTKAFFVMFIILIFAIRIPSICHYNVHIFLQAICNCFFRQYLTQKIKKVTKIKTYSNQSVNISKIFNRTQQRHIALYYNFVFAL